MCNKCLNSANHEMCVVNILSSVNATPTVKKVLNKGKQIWKPKGKLSDKQVEQDHSGLFKTYDGESFKAQEFCGKVHRDCDHQEYTRGGHGSQSILCRAIYDSDLEVGCSKAISFQAFVQDINGEGLT
ncbi:hypothetical protein Tco_1329712 [Tanacetum coccineum]